MPYKWISTAVSIIWTAVVIYLHVIRIQLPQDKPLFQFPHGDKVVHFTLFAVLTLLWSITMEHLRGRSSTLATVLFLILCSSFLGAMLEYIQHILPAQRDGDWLDWIADVIGSITGIVLSRRFYIRKWMGLQRRENQL